MCEGAAVARHDVVVAQEVQELNGDSMIKIIIIMITIIVVVVVVVVVAVLVVVVLVVIAGSSN